MKNWKTTLAGVLTGLGTAADALIDAAAKGQFTGKTGVQLALAAGLVLFGVFAKDHDVTGGTTVNQPNSAIAVKKATKTTTL